MIEEPTLERVLARALRTGGEFAEVFAEDKQNGSATLDDGRVEQLSSGRDRGAGIRVVVGETTGFAHTADLSEQGLLTAAEAASAAAREGGGGVREIALTRRDVVNPSVVRTLPDDVPKADKVAILRQADEAARAFAREISQVTASVAGSRRRICIANSDGLLTTDDQVRTLFSVSARGHRRHRDADRPQVHRPHHRVGAVRPDRHRRVRRRGGPDGDHQAAGPPGTVGPAARGHRCGLRRRPVPRGVRPRPREGPRRQGRVGVRRSDGPAGGQPARHARRRRHHRRGVGRLRGRRRGLARPAQRPDPGRRPHRLHVGLPAQPQGGAGAVRQRAPPVLPAPADGPHDQHVPRERHGEPRRRHRRHGPRGVRGQAGRRPGEHRVGRLRLRHAGGVPHRGRRDHRAHPRGEPHRQRPPVPPGHRGHRRRLLLRRPWHVRQGRTGRAGGRRLPHPAGEAAHHRRHELDGGTGSAPGRHRRRRAPGPRRPGGRPGRARRAGRGLREPGHQHLRRRLPRRDRVPDPGRLGGRRDPGDPGRPHGLRLRQQPRRGHRRRDPGRGRATTCPSPSPTSGPAWPSPTASQPPASTCTGRRSSPRRSRTRSPWPSSSSGWCSPPTPGSGACAPPATPMPRAPTPSRPPPASPWAVAPRSPTCRCRRWPTTATPPSSPAACRSVGPSTSSRSTRPPTTRSRACSRRSAR